MSSGFGPDELLDCYREGVFPMGEDADDSRIFIVDPDVRGVIPLDGFHLSRSLKKIVRSDRFKVTVDTCFTTVMEACAEPTPERPSTWINTPIVNLYAQLHRRGHAHSVECWQGDVLVGGLYGVSLGGAFFGESMFSRVSNASKVALTHLVARLIAGGYKLLDTQFMTSHLASLGAVEMSRDTFQEKLAEALEVKANFYSVGAASGSPPSDGDSSVSGDPSSDSESSPSTKGSSMTGGRAVQLITQTS